MHFGIHLLQTALTAVPKTGDLGSFDRKGRLSIRGRIKTMILGSSGENIYPEEIESIINNFRFVNESLVVESKGKLVAMVHFNMEELEKQVQKIKSQAGNYKTAINDYTSTLLSTLVKNSTYGNSAGP